MPHVVIENCMDCKFTDCVEVCPVQCFYTSDEENMLYIHPDECIDCKLCVPECPVEAIYDEEDLPDGTEKWVQINADKCESGNLDVIADQQDPLPTAEEKKSRLGL